MDKWKGAGFTQYFLYEPIAIKWWSDFNSSIRQNSYKNQWTSFKIFQAIVESGTDINDYEGLFKGEVKFSISSIDYLR